MNLTTKARRSRSVARLKLLFAFFVASWLNSSYAGEISLGKIEPKAVELSPDGKHYAYVHVESPEKSWVIFDGQPQQEFRRVGSVLRFSSDGQHFAYAAEASQDSWVFVLDQLQGRSFAAIDQASITFSADSSVAAYIATREQNTYVMLGAQTFGGFARASQLTVSHDGTRAAFVVQPGHAQPAELYLNRDSLGTFNRVDDIAFSDDGLEIAASGQRDHHPVVARFGAEPTFYDLDAGEIFFLPASHKLMSIPRRGGRGDISIDGAVLANISRGFEGISFTPDGRTISYTAAADSAVMKSDGMVIDSDRRAYFSPDGQRTIYSGAQAVDAVRLVDLGVQKIRCATHTAPIFSASNKIAFVALTRDNEPTVYFEETPSEKFDQIRIASLTFSRDGNHLAYAARRNGKWIVVIDQVSQPGEFDDIPDRAFVPDADGKFHFLAIRGGDTFLCTTPAPK